MSNTHAGSGLFPREIKLFLLLLSLLLLLVLHIHIKRLYLVQMKLKQMKMTTFVWSIYCTTSEDKRKFLSYVFYN